jgi:cell shape-determining protein MreC
LQSFGNAATLDSRNEQLMNENAALASENQTLFQKLANISALSGSQTVGKNVPTGILAGVVARPPESPYDTLVLAAGENEGVALGQEAFGAGGVPIGVVSSVLADFSRVTLFSAPGTNTVGWVGRTNLPLTIFGAGAGAMNATSARSAGIAVGDTVFVPGPGMLPIGTVTRIDSDPSSPSVTLRIQPALNLFSITWVLLRDTGAALLISATSTIL